jgi:NADPH:quinone reductase
VQRHLRVDDPVDEPVLLEPAQHRGEHLRTDALQPPLQRTEPLRPAASDAPRVIDFDAAGVVREVGAEVTAFAPGDEVYYAGPIARTGSNAGLQLVDSRITGHKPASLDFAEAAALPLTTITAWETLFDRLRLGPGATGTLLVVSAAGGVGSMVVQLARLLTGLEIVGTASRAA